ncbi:beta strand repeat-containing protein [Peredibacter sp. HCB2-198]|uniref:beta strand repeat-containing protein n=1 Tax=Peredibacter sp. HCB2-198 TaxID=3383025 RepID=UPI0038B452C9
MFKNLYFLFIGLLLFLISCQEASILPANIKVKINETRPSISKVVVQNDQLIVTGKNLDGVILARIEGNTNHNFQIESKSENQLILNAKSALSLLVGETFNLIVGNASANATFPISFELQNGQVTAAKLHHMGATAGQFLQFNGTNWAPASISSSQIFAGAYDAATDTPDIISIGGSAGTYYIVSVAGSKDLGAGSVLLNVGDWVIYNGSIWEKLAVGANTVSAFNGRTGLVVPEADDYSWSMLTKTAGKLTGSKVSEIADVDVTGIQDGDILQWDAGTTKWEVNSVPTPTISAGSITSTQLANSAVDSNKIVDGTIVNADISAAAAIDQSKINGLTGALNGKEASLPTGGTAAHYLNGNKTWVDFTTSVLGTQLSGYVIGVAGAISPLDTINLALGKLEARDSVISAAQSNYVLLNGTSPMTGDLQMGNNQITGLGAPGADTDAATKKYVDDEIANATLGGGSSQWTTAGSNIYYNTGNVGIGVLSPGYALEVQGIAAANNFLLKGPSSRTITLSAPASLLATYALNLPISAGSNNQVLTTDGSGNLSWTTPASGGAPTGAAGGELSGTYPNPTIANGLPVTRLSDGSIDNTEFGYLNGATSNIQTQLNNVTTTVLAAPIGSVSETAIPLLTTDTIPQAVGKLNAYIGALSTSQAGYLPLNGSSAMTGDLQMGNNQITGLGAPGADTDAATKKYVDDEVTAASKWLSSSSDIYFDTGKVGIGTNAPTATLQIGQNSGSANPAQLFFGEAKTSGGGRPNIVGQWSSNDSWGIGPATSGIDQMLRIGKVTGLDSDWAVTQDLVLSVPVLAVGTTTPLQSGVATFNGNVGIGNNNPSEKLDVTGNIALTGKLLLKSDTANYVELKAPIGLGSTYTLNFPLNDGSTNQVLTTDGSGNLSWTTPAGGGAPTGAAGGELSGSYPNPTIANGLSVTRLSDGSIDNTEFAHLNGVTSNIQTQLDAKEGALPAGGVAGDYLRGNKTWSNFSTDVQASVIGTFTPVTGSQVSALDSILNALQKLQGQINDLVSDLSDSITWTKNGSNIEYNTGNVGIGRTPATKLDVNGGIRPGSETSVTTCGLGATNGEGTQRYNYTTHRMEYCDGGAWVAMNGKSDYGTLTITGAANCRWELTSSSWNKYVADTDCPNPVLTGAALAPSEGKIPAIRFASLPAGEYEVHLNAYSMYAVNDGFCMYRLSDGTNFSGMSNSDGYYLLELNFLVGRFRYTTDQTNITFYLEAKSPSAPTETCRTDNSVVGQDKIQFWVNRL